VKGGIPYKSGVTIIIRSIEELRAGELLIVIRREVKPIV
jgi:hypothetical protein